MQGKEFYEDDTSGKGFVEGSDSRQSILISPFIALINYSPVAKSFPPPSWRISSERFVLNSTVTRRVSGPSLNGD